MIRALVILICLLVARPAEAVGQRPVPVSSWVTELTAGVALDLAVRGPWMAPTLRESPLRRVLFTTTVSLLYEYVLEPWNGYANGARWQDVGERLTGVVGMEVLLWLLPNGPPKSEQRAK